MKKQLALGVACAALLGAGFSGGAMAAWSLEAAAEPYRGTTITVVGLERPSYAAARELTPQFEKETGIHVRWTVFPYESTLKAETLNFVSQSDQYDAILSDIVWPVTFADAGWVVPMKKFMDNPKLRDPDLDLPDFFPVWLAAFTVRDELYGLPFDSYAGLLYYNKKTLQEAGFDAPPKTWDELLEYSKKLTDKDKGFYGYVLQSAHNETQTADAFARFLWPWGGRFLDLADKKVMVNAPESVQGIEFRRQLVELMPSGIVSDDHPQIVQMLAQGRTAMITEWSSFYTTLKQSPMGDDLGVAVEPAGPKAAVSALGGFAYMVSAQAPEKKQDAAYLFIQWLTSKAMAKPLIEKGAVVARRGADTDPEVQQRFPYLAPMVETWLHRTVPDWRPQVQCYPQFSDTVSDWGSRIEQKRLPIQENLDKLAEALSRDMSASNCWDHASDPGQYMARYEKAQP